LVFLLAFNNLDLLLKISKLGLSLFPQGVSLLLPDYHVI
jgi:hypothetical protein